MNVIAETARQLLSVGAPFVLATIFSRHGSAPRTAGTRMIVAADGRAIGTIGGGLFEARVAERASEVLASKASAVMAFDMSHDDVAGMDMICGGRVEVLLEYIKPGTAAAAVYAAWRDPERAPEPCLLVTVVRFAAGKMDRITHGFLRDGQAICGHLHDLTVLRQALRTPAGCIGMIGSRHKRKQVFDALSREGFSERDLNRVHSPIGIDIGAESCEEIAVSIVAELVQARARNRGR